MLSDWQFLSNLKYIVIQWSHRPIRKVQCGHKALYTREFSRQRAHDKRNRWLTAFCRILCHFPFVLVVCAPQDINPMAMPIHIVSGCEVRMCIGWPAKKILYLSGSFTVMVVISHCSASSDDEKNAQCVCCIKMKFHVILLLRTTSMLLHGQYLY